MRYTCTNTVRTYLTRLTACLTKGTSLRKTLNLPKVQQGGETDWARLAKLLDEIKQVRSEVWGTSYSVFEEELVTLAKSELQVPYCCQMLETALLQVKCIHYLHGYYVKAIATSRPFQGKVLRDWVRKMEADDIGRIHQSIQIELTLGETTPSLLAYYWL